MNSQLIGLLVSTGLTLILLFSLYYFVIKKEKQGEAPTSRIMVFLELYYEVFRKLIRSLSGGQHEWSHLYLFTLFNFIFINSLTPWIGLEATPTSIMFTFPLALLSFIGIFIIGIGTMGFIGFCKHKYSNPMELVMQFAPLISMSVRLFGATFAGAVIGNVPWIIIAGVSSDAFSGRDISTWAPTIQIFVMIFWKLADTALSLIQAFVFITLTIIFWCLDTGPSWSAEDRKKIKEAKASSDNNETTAEVDFTTMEELDILSEVKEVKKESLQETMKEVQNE